VRPRRRGLPHWGPRRLVRPPQRSRDPGSAALGQSLACQPLPFRWKVGDLPAREVARWRRPRLVANGDPDRDQILAALLQTIAGLPAGAVVLAEDETHINLLPWVRATWIAKGQRQQVMTPGTNRRRTIFGAVDLASGRFLYQVARKAVSATFTQFLEQLLAAYPAAPVVAVVCDNVIIHHSKIVGRWLEAHRRIMVLHGARYSPHDNPVEWVWGALKAWLANTPTLTIQGRVRQVHAFFRARSPTDPGDRRAVQLTVAARGLRAEPQGGRLGRSLFRRRGRLRPGQRGRLDQGVCGTGCSSPSTYSASTRSL